MRYYPDANYPDGDYPDYPDDQGNRRPLGCYNNTLKPGFQDFGRGAFYGSLWSVRVSIEMHVLCPSAMSHQPHFIQLRADPKHLAQKIIDRLWLTSAGLSHCRKQIRPHASFFFALIAASCITGISPPSCANMKQATHISITIAPPFIALCQVPHNYKCSMQRPNQSNTAACPELAMGTTFERSRHPPSAVSMYPTSTSPAFVKDFSMRIQWPCKDPATATLQRHR